MINLDFYNKTDKEIDQNSIEQIIQTTAENKAKELYKKQTSVSVFIVGDTEMKKLHKKWMETYEVTDVLSFPLDKDDNFPDKIVRLGDIVVCYSVAARQAKENARSVQEEINFLVQHGLLHLLGFHHD